MSMAITSMPSALSLPGTPGDAASSSDASSGSLDFASLLLGSLAAGISPLGNLLAEKPAAAPSDPAPDAPAGATDSALLLAALGLAPRQAAATLPNGEQALPDAPATTALPDAAALLQPPPAAEPANTLARSKAPSLPEEEGSIDSAFAALLGETPGNTRYAALPAKDDNGNGNGKTAKIAASDLLAANKNRANTLDENRQEPAAALSMTSHALPGAPIDAKTEPGAENLPLEAAKPGATLAAASAAHLPGTAEMTSKPTRPPQDAAWSPRMDTPLHDAAWGSDFSQKIVWLAGNEQQSAQITLNPPQLGPIDISLNINKDSATALFVSANPEVRDSIEAALPRLREMLAGSGIELGQASVSEQSPRQQAGQEGAKPGTPRWQVDNAILVAGSGGSANGSLLQRGNGLVDTFA